MSAEPPGTGQPPPASLPPSPWVLVDTTTIDQAAAALARFEAWLLHGKPAATAACAHALSCGEDDPAGVVAGWVGGHLADHLRHRVQEVDTWS